MRRKQPRNKHRRRLTAAALSAILAGTAAVTAFSYYVNNEIKPTLHQLAEYEARAATVKAVNLAVSAAIEETPDLCRNLYRVQEDTVYTDTTALNRVRGELVAAVEETLQAQTETCYYVPFGTLTDNTLLTGYGPGWRIRIKPQGYVESSIRETVLDVSINRTQYTAVLEIRVIVNMILIGDVSTVEILQEVPLVSVVVGGEVPSTYGSDVD